MRKSTETEHQLKLAIRNILARDPLTSVQKIQRDLKERGFQTSNGSALDWHYVSKLVRKLAREAAFSVDDQKIGERLAITKESYRLMVERLWRIIDYKWEYLEKFGLYPPKTDEIIKAINTLMKLDLAILKAEMDAGIFERKIGTVDINMLRAAPIDPEQADTIVQAFKNWGIDLSGPLQRSQPVHTVNGTTATAEGISRNQDVAAVEQRVVEGIIDELRELLCEWLYVAVFDDGRRSAVIRTENERVSGGGVDSMRPPRAAERCIAFGVVGKQT